MHDRISLRTTAGTITDTQNMIIGNLVAANRGFPGEICEIIGWKSTPSAVVLEAIRRNEAAFYGLGSTVN